MSDHEYRQRWQEAQEEARRRQDEHTRTMVVYLEAQVKALHQRCAEAWQIADEQKVVIGGLIERLDKASAEFGKLKKSVASLGEGKLGD